MRTIIIPIMKKAILGLACLLAVGCSQANESRTIVASIYPLAFAAERMAQPGYEVIDLTPPGVEAHDVELSLEQRSAIEDADIVFYLGDIGFQPQVERAVQEAEGVVVDLAGGLKRDDGVVDPHVWLEPSSFAFIMSQMRQGLCNDNDPCSTEEVEAQDAFVAELGALHDEYTGALVSCRYRAMIVSHEAFGYLELYGLRQVGLAGLTPEAEPSAERLANARQLIENGEAGALFYEARGEDPAGDQVLAEDLGVPALPLDTLESRPPAGDYLSVMEGNLESLREGLRCR
jgi:zinc transport system substrate-binding protein